MKGRCYKKNSISYKDHGGRGITICDEWLNDFINFRQWALSSGYRQGLTIDREDNDGNYEPLNCRFVTQAENNKNKRNTKLNWLTVRLMRALRINGYTVKELHAIFNISLGNLKCIIYNQRWKEELYCEQLNCKGYIS